MYMGGCEHTHIYIYIYIYKYKLMNTHHRTLKKVTKVTKVTKIYNSEL